jgi:hypothetical protein
VKRHALLAVLVVGTLALPLPTSAAPLEWTTPVAIGADLPSSWFPDLYADQTGKVRVVWSSNLENGDGNVTHSITGAVMLSELQNDQWTAPADLAVMDAGTASRPFLVSDGAYAHLIYRTEQGFNRVRLVYRRAPLGVDISNAQAWSEPQSLTTDETYWASLLLVSDGTLVVAYNQEAASSAGDRRPALFVRRSLDDGETWSAPLRISNNDGRVARVSLVATHDGQHLLAAWDEGYDNLQGIGDPAGIATAMSEDAGLTWSPEQFMLGDQEQSVVAMDESIAVLVSRSTHTDTLLYRLSYDGGRSWSDAATIPLASARPYTDKHNFDKLSLAFDGDERLWLAYVGTNLDAPNGLSVMTTSFSNAVWDAPEIIASPVGFPEYPRLSVALGNHLNVVYFVRDSEFDVGHYTLWWVSALTSGKGSAAVAVRPAQPQTVVQPTAATIELAPNPAVPAAPSPLPAGTQAGAQPQSIGAAPIHRAVAMTLLALLACMCLAWVGSRLWNARI